MRDFFRTLKENPRESLETAAACGLAVAAMYLILRLGT